MPRVTLCAVVIIGTCILGSAVALVSNLQPVDVARVASASPMAGDLFGSGVSVTQDQIAIGASENFSGATGFATVFQRNGSGTPLDPTDDTWIEAARLTASDANSGDLFGFSIELADSYLVVGAPNKVDSGSVTGSAYVFYREDNGTPSNPNDDTWLETQKLLASDAMDQIGFGDDVAMSGDWLVIGAGDSLGTGRPGAAYVFRLMDNGTRSDASDDLWLEHAKLVPSDGEEDDVFGGTVAIKNEWILIGAPLDDDNGPISGSAYVYRRDDNGSPDVLTDDSWVEHQKLLPSDGTQADLFGYAVRHDAHRAVIGARLDDDASFRAGSAYVFRRDDNGTSSDTSDDVWVEEAKLLASDPIEDHEFGFSVSINGDVVCVGAPGDGDVGDCSGAAYVFRLDDGGTPEDPTDDVWNEETKLIASNASPGYQFGLRVELGGWWGTIAAPLDSDQASVAGAASVYYMPSDCNENGVDDLSDISGPTSADCNANFTPDECEPNEDCNTNTIQDICDIADGTSLDCNSNLVPDECDAAGATSGDCNANVIPDECESQADCNGNDVQDFCDIALGTSGDCNANGLPDECDPDNDCNTNGFQDICDIALGTSPDVDANGIPDECCFASNAPQPEMLESVVSAKNRILSVLAGDAGRLQALRVMAVSLPPPFDTWNGQRWFAQQPVQVCENAGQGLDVTPPDCGAVPGFPQKWFWAAPLFCDEATAHFMDWTTLQDYCTVSGEACSVDADCTAGTCGVDGVVHLYHQGVVPSTLQAGGGAIETPATYDVQVVDSMCSTSYEPNYSQPLALIQSGFGDVVDAPGACPAGGPNQDVSLIGDITETIRRFSNLNCAPRKVRCEMEPAEIDFMINFTDVLRILNAFTGGTYSEQPGAGPCN